MLGLGLPGRLVPSSDIEPAREVEVMMAHRGVQLSSKTIRRWCDKFGNLYAEKLSGKDEAEPMSGI